MERLESPAVEPHTFEPRIRKDRETDRTMRYLPTVVVVMFSLERRVVAERLAVTSTHRKA